MTRAKALTRRALAQLDEARDPLTCAWFQLKLGLLTEEAGKGDGWAQIAKAQELVRGLPPSAVHAEVLSSAASWGMVHRPGREALATAVRAVELARVVGATVIELGARVTLGTLLAQSGDLEAGLAEMARARDEADEAGLTSVVIRAATNIAVELELAGRWEQAAAEAARAARVARERNRPNSYAGALASHAEALLATGEWDEAATLLDEAKGAARAADVRAWVALLRAHLAHDRGDQPRLVLAVEEVVAALGSSPVVEPQKAVALRHFTMVLAARRGDLQEARAELARALREGFRPGSYPQAWALLTAAAAHEAETRGLPGSAHGRGPVLDALRRAARQLPRPAPVWEGHALLLEADLARAAGANDPRHWEAAALALEPLGRPHPLAQARLRWAEALLDSGTPRRQAPRHEARRPAAAQGSDSGRSPGDPGRFPEDSGRSPGDTGGSPGDMGRSPGDAGRSLAGTGRSPGELLRAAGAAALRLGAAPLRAEAEALALRARIDLDDKPAADPAPTPQALPAAFDPAESFGLTRRERGVLELVAEGLSNRQIAERLHIAPKTASVHVSHILAKLGVAGRGEAAAMAFRLRLVTPQGAAVPGPVR
ncbi:LuxR C-terminal-related transcriptional regulator [Streptomyces sp. PU-14G]|uniref:LuxR C-terminal-related transcriptional regulator n=1 Tax=Streptomyces sp. PU-14G TaxID=2800808 RepID=UPI0034DF4149